jgi:hypothetical protein
MSKPKYSVRIGNVYFLSRIGLSLRWATQGVAPGDLSADIKQLLTRLDQIEAMEAEGDSGAKSDSDAAV